MKTRRNRKVKGSSVRGGAPPRGPPPRGPPPRGPPPRGPPPPPAPPAVPVITVTHVQPLIDAFNLVNKDMPSIAPNGPPGLLAPLQPLMMKISQSISNNNGIFYVNGLDLTEQDVKPVVDLYNSLTPGLKELLPKIMPPLLTPVFKLILPQAGFP